MYTPYPIAATSPTDINPSMTSSTSSFVEKLLMVAHEGSWKSRGMVFTRRYSSLMPASAMILPNFADSLRMN